jgi:hypothetical protein
LIGHVPLGEWKTISAPATRPFAVCRQPDAATWCRAA